MGPERETDIQYAICEYLSYRKDVFFWRSNNMPVFQRETGTYRALPKYGIAGVADILAVKNGQAWALEVKRKSKYQSEPQKQFQANFERVGGKYAVVRNVEEVVSLGL